MRTPENIREFKKVLAHLDKAIKIMEDIHDKQTDFYWDRSDEWQEGEGIDFEDRMNETEYKLGDLISLKEEIEMEFLQP